MQMNEFFYGGNEQPPWQEVADYQRPCGYRANFDNRNTGRTLPTYEFRVPMCCAKCVEKVREELSELEGAYEVFADQLSERAAVTGFVDPFQALKKMKRIKKKSKFWDRSSPTLKSSHHKKSSSYTSNSSESSYKKHHSRHDQTVYRSSPTKFISYNKEPSRASSSHRRPNYASYDDGVSYSSLRPARSLEPSYRQSFGYYDDSVMSYPDHGVSYRKNYGSYDDGVSYSDLNRPSSSLFLPRSRSLQCETVPPFAQDYYTEDYVEDYPMFNRY